MTGAVDCLTQPEGLSAGRDPRISPDVEAKRTTVERFRPHEQRFRNCLSVPTDESCETPESGVNRRNRMLSVWQSFILAGVFAAASGCAFHPNVNPSGAAAVPTHSESASCGARPFDATEVGRRAAAGTLMLEVGNNIGSGFIIRDGNESLVVTNLHVIASGEAPIAHWTMPDGSREHSRLEVVMISRKYDLALLRAQAHVDATPLVLATRPPEIGQGVAVAGYPGVAGSQFVLTFEPGTVTATQRSFATADFIQTNANINPGNSGGPLFDGCGRVVGVVVARSRNVERLGLVIPAQAVSELLNEYHQPQPDPKAAATQRLQQFLTEVKFRRNDKAADYFSRAFLDKFAVDGLRRATEDAKSKVAKLMKDLEKKGTSKHWDRDQKMKYLKSRLSATELRALALSEAVEEKKLTPRHAGAFFYADWAVEAFGNVNDVWLESTSVSAEGCFEGYVTAAEHDGTMRRYLVHMHHEVGEWLVEFVKQMR